MGKTLKDTPYRYGKDANPRNWYETVDALNSLNNVKKTKKSSGLYDRLAAIESLLKQGKS